MDVHIRARDCTHEPAHTAARKCVEAPHCSKCEAGDSLTWCASPVDFSAKLDAILFSNYEEFVNNIAETSSMLEEVLNSPEGRRVRRTTSFKVQVLGMGATCGQGYSSEPGSSNSSDSNTSPSSDCIPCALGFHKEAMDNSPCLACPKHATTNFSGTIDPSSCTCKDGYTAANASQTSSSELGGQSLVCVNARQYVSEKDAKEAAQAVSTAVGVVVGANVAVAVGTAVHARTNTHTHTHTHTLSLR